MSMGIIESGEYNKVAGLGGDAGSVEAVTGYSTPGKASGYETVTRTGNVVMIDFTTLTANAEKVLTGLPKPVNMTHCILFDYASLVPSVCYISPDGEFFVPSGSLNVELYGQLIYFTNEV